MRAGVGLDVDGVGAARTERLHSLDALRAAMMLLGVVLHAGNSYLAHPVPDAWRYSDPDRSLVFDVMAFLIHGFRMPVFFTLAGFFAALLVAHRGCRGFSANRTWRVLVPLTLFVLPVWAADEIAAALAHDPRPAALLNAVVSLVLPKSMAILGHLWFLYYLALFYLLLCAVVVVCRRFFPRARAARLGGWLARWWAPAVPALPLALVLFGQPFAVLNTQGTLLPELPTLVGYGASFAVGAWLFLRPDALEAMRRHALRLLAAGIALQVACLLLLLVQVGDQEAVQLASSARAAVQLPLAVSSALGTSLLTFGLIGAAQRVFARHHPLVRYLADASYWIYLVHHAQVIALAGLLGGWRAPALLKFSVVVVVALASSLVSYHLLVRSTPLGVLLNGRRYPFRWRATAAPTGTAAGAPRRRSPARDRPAA